MNFLIFIIFSYQKYLVMNFYTPIPDIPTSIYYVHIFTYQLCLLYLYFHLFSLYALYTQLKPYSILGIPKNTVSYSSGLTSSGRISGINPVSRCTISAIFFVLPLYYLELTLSQEVFAAFLQLFVNQMSSYLKSPQKD